ncbi:nitrogen fixation protein NifX [Rhodovibrio salinarum]|uniref:Nitrogen fixation protein NifX n=1 Tax=Rhodovibrio salinarum TaxID=1087 RepID=A0A934QLA9_9PROT|nr:nitrogen fixation protein NifX [Rhodovibrio salinarum]MBK1698986.1 nitrogen fixation protein NifX [Rhodovibrio salinarum]
MKVALASETLTAVDAHFAKAANLAIYDVTPAGWTFVTAIPFDQANTATDVDRVAARIAALDGCVLLFVKGIGGPAAARVVKARVHPIAVQQDTAADAVLERVRGMLADGPPPWLAKRLTADAPQTAATNPPVAGA